MQEFSFPCNEMVLSKQTASVSVPDSPDSTTSILHSSIADMNNRLHYDSGTVESTESIPTSVAGSVNSDIHDSRSLPGDCYLQDPLTERRNGLYLKVSPNNEETQHIRPRTATMPAMALANPAKPPLQEKKRKLRSKFRDLFKKGSNKNLWKHMEQYDNTQHNLRMFQAGSFDSGDFDPNEDAFSPGELEFSQRRRTETGSKSDSVSNVSASSGSLRTRGESESSDTTAGSHTPKHKGHHNNPARIFHRMQEKALAVLEQLGLPVEETCDMTVTSERVTAAEIKQEADHAREIIEAFMTGGHVTATTEPEEMELLGITHVVPNYVTCEASEFEQLSQFEEPVFATAEKIQFEPHNCPIAAIMEQIKHHPHEEIEQYDNVPTPAPASLTPVPVVPEAEELLVKMCPVRNENPYRYLPTEKRRR